MKAQICLLRYYKLTNTEETPFIAKHGLSKNHFEVLRTLYHMEDIMIGELIKLIINLLGKYTYCFEKFKT